MVSEADHNCRTLTSQNNNNKNRLRNCIVCHSYSGDLCPMPIFSRSTCLLFGFCGSCLRWLVGNSILNSELITIAIMPHIIAHFRLKEENSVCVFLPNCTWQVWEEYLTSSRSLMDVKNIWLSLFMFTALAKLIYFYLSY